MKRTISLFLIMVVLIAVFFVIINANRGIEEHQLLTSTITAFNPEKSMRISIPEIGLKNVLIRQLEDNINLTENSFATVYLLADNRYDKNSVVADYYLVLTINGKIIAKDLSVWEDQADLSGTFFCVDIDGDGDKEIILQECIGLSGGAGQYLSRVFDFKNDEIVEIFSSDVNGATFNTGFWVTILKDKRLKIENIYTDYCEKFSLLNRDDNYYNNAREPKELTVDTFYKFEPWDIDNDGAYEIKCCQYASLYGHSDFIGTAVSFLKYNKENNSFDICEAFFEVEKIL